MKTRAPAALFILALTSAPIGARADDAEWDVAKLDFSKVPPAATQPGITYLKDVRPLFQASCFRCHGEEKQRGELRLDALEYVLKGGEDGKVIAPGASEKSLLVASIARLTPKIAMPPQRSGSAGKGNAKESAKAPAAPPASGQKAFTPEQIALVRAWIDQGAK